MVNTSTPNQEKGVEILQIELQKLVPHEALDIRKLRILEKELNLSQEMYCNPLVYKYRNNKYIILDGHHRIACLKNLGVDKISCEVVPKEQINYSQWSHTIYDKTFMTYLLNLPDIYISKIYKKDYIFQLVNKGSMYFVYSIYKQNLKSRQQIANQLINYYLLSGNYKKIPCQKNIPESDELVVIFEKIELNKILNGSISFCPSGSTRFQIK